jgi:hypothetical protein
MPSGPCTATSPTVQPARCKRLCGRRAWGAFRSLVRRCEGQVARVYLGSHRSRRARTFEVIDFPSPEPTELRSN